MSDFDFSMKKVEFSKNGVDVVFTPNRFVPMLDVHSFDFDCDGGYDSSLHVEKVGHKFRYTLDVMARRGNCETGVFSDTETHEKGTCDYAYLKEFPYMVEVMEFLFKAGYRF